MEKSLFEKHKYFVKIILFVFVSLVTYIVTMTKLKTEFTDYYVHMTYALNFKRENLYLFTDISEYSLSYPLWHFIVYAAYRISLLLFGNLLGPEYATAFVSALMNGCVFWITEKILSRFKLARPEWAAFALCFVMPFNIPGWLDHILYFGQSSPVVWHNPTNIIVKIFALLGFFITSDMLTAIEEKKKISRKQYISLSAVVFLSVLAKPSFFQGFVPTLGLYILIHLIRTKFSRIRDYILICACFIPGFLVILFQFLISFYIGKESGGIAIGWLEILKEFYPSPLLQLFLTLVFPVSYILFNFKKYFKSVMARLSCLYVITSWLEAALLYEKGMRKMDGNFEWAVSLAYAMIWTVTSGMFFKDWQEMELSNKKEKTKNTFLFVLFLMHFIFGISYLWKLLTAERQYF